MLFKLPVVAFMSGRVSFPCSSVNKKRTCGVDVGKRVPASSLETGRGSRTWVKDIGTALQTAVVAPYEPMPGSSI